MILSDDLICEGYTIEPVGEGDSDQYMKIRKDFLKPFVDQYYGGWVEEIQMIIANDLFHRTRKDASFLKILKSGETIGFLAYKEQPDQITDISVIMSESGQEIELLGEFLHFITRLSDRTKKPVLLTVYQSAPFADLYLEHGFTIYGTSRTHYLMSYNIEDTSGMGDYKNRIYAAGIGKDS
ncbi:hypothetical protein LAD12857_36670 [Lacrimispora amygdalina]|uniref:N-acetyltransferase domain-containing protein n=1 Tax=Lacrimispora amygdalina TaxID=253257 RepID=A0A3E2N8E1_9FIRM|nr:hypothetical protein [Clostridium indicum]RFZ77275.1 hypothetical protein DS742_18955 [Clostridium indicum]